MKLAVGGSAATETGCPPSRAAGARREPADALAGSGGV